MIESEAEYQEALRRISDQAARIDKQQDSLQGKELSEDEIKRVLDPIRSFHEQLKEDVTFYERRKRDKST